MKETACIILAGGLGTRLRSIVADVPKCLAPIGGRPFLEYQIKSLSARGVQRFILALGYGAKQVLNQANRIDTECPIECIVEPHKLGTGGAIGFAFNNSNIEEAIVVNGDTYIGGSLEKMLTPISRENNELVRIGGIRVENRSRFGGIETDASGRVIGFYEKGTQGAGLISAGIYRVHRSALNDRYLDSYSVESDVFPVLSKKGSLFAVELDGPFVDIGIPEDYIQYFKNHAQYQ